MERKYLFLVSFFATVTIVSLLGFYTSYLSAFPNYSKFQNIIHLHFIAFFLWFFLVICQPILIKKRKFSLHRKLGRFSYFLAPVLLITICLLVKAKTEREITESVENAAMTAFIGLVDAVSFSVYYIIAMVNRKNVRWHVAFIIATTLVVLNPGMARLFNGFSMGLGLLAAVVVPFFVSGSIVIFEKFRLNRPVLKSPYALFFLLWALEIALLVIVPSTPMWKDFTVAVFG